MARYLLYDAVAQHLHRLFLVKCRQHIELPGSIALKIKANGGSKEYGQNNANGLYKVVLHKSQNQRHNSSHQQDANNGIFVFLQV